MCSVEHTGRPKLGTSRTRHARSSTWLTRLLTNWKPQTPDLTANGSSKRPRSASHDHHHPTTRTCARAGSAGEARRRRLCERPVRLTVLVSWFHDWDLHLDERAASWRTLDPERPSERLDSIPEPGQPRPSACMGAADAVIANRKQEHVVVNTQGNPHPRGVRVLGRVRQRLRDGVISGDLDVVREPLLEGHVELDADGGAAPKRFERRCESALAEDRWMDAP